MPLSPAANPMFNDGLPPDSGGAKDLPVDKLQPNAVLALRLLLAAGNAAAALFLRSDLIVVWGGMMLGTGLTVIAQFSAIRRRFQELARLLYVVGDLSVICLAIYGFGSLSSPVPIFLVVVVLANGLQFGARVAILSWILASLAYTTIVFLEFRAHFASAPLLRGGSAISSAPVNYTVVVIIGLAFTTVLVVLFLRQLSVRDTSLQDLRNREQQAHERALTLEKQLASANRLDALGRLAGGVAHDFNNLLTLIIGYVRHAQRAIESSHPARADLDEVGLAVQRASSLTRHLLAFSRQQKGEPRPVDVCEILARMKSLFVRVLSETITIKLELKQPQVVVLADPGQLEQVLLHLVVNARDAMPQGGALQLSCDSLSVPEAPGPEDPLLAPGKHACIVVSDTGVGMSAKTLERIFEPFFSSKKQGTTAGLGLGLAAVHGIVSASGGELQVESRVGQGSKFTIYWPLATIHSGHALTPVEGVVLPKLVGQERILVVEDEAKLATIIQRTLEQHGYHVTQAESSEQALALVSQGLEMDLLLTDVVLTGQPGTALAEELLREHPTLQVLFISGHGDEVLARYPLSGFDLLIKPFTDQQLLTRIRQTLDAARGKNPKKL